uniref:Secreted protein n=1 Tax=Eutreptiella gymnastica TaxID=73025 RepID=A0A7S4GJ53_9EUGL
MRNKPTVLALLLGLQRFGGLGDSLQKVAGHRHCISEAFMLCSNVTECRLFEACQRHGSTLWCTFQTSGLVEVLAIAQVEVHIHVGDGLMSKTGACHLVEVFSTDEIRILVLDTLDMAHLES